MVLGTKLNGTKKTEHTRTKIFVLSKCQIFVNKMFQNNFERLNSACQSFNLTTLLSHIRVSELSHMRSANKVTGKYA